jgi:hypothetical protein
MYFQRSCDTFLSMRAFRIGENFFSCCMYLARDIHRVGPGPTSGL